MGGITYQAKDTEENKTKLWQQPEMQREKK